jgi:NADPH:quinone reductase-like Zn-dependent oxidoreductase/acyl carrier protein
VRDSIALLHIIQALTREPRHPMPRLYVVTSGLQGALPYEEIHGVGQAALWGMQRVAANEHPALRPLSVDLEFGHPDINQLAAEIIASEDEPEVALRGGKRYVARLNRAAPQATDDAAIAGPTTPYMLKMKKPGLIDNLEFQESERVAPGRGEVEVRVHVSAINFKDIMKTMDMLPDRYLERTYFSNELGLECVGEVVAVGEGVTHLHVGDAVVVPDPKGSFRSYTNVPVDFIVPKPTRFSYEEGTFIANWVAPYYGLHEIARLQPGERVLIHAATGGVGLAAIQIARWKGAEIYATAGSEQKRDYLRSLGITHVSDSRSLQFVDDILAWTNGEGVDVILNSLAGEALTHSLNLLAPYGRFVEIGKRDITENKALALAAFDRNLTFTAVDIDKMMLERPALFRRLEEEVYALTENGTFNALPTTVFPAVAIKEAFRFVREARHIGKVVVQMREQPVTYRPRASAPVQVRPNSAYLITGGTGGFGLEAARWLAAKGATHLVLASRHGITSRDAQTIIAQLAARGVTVVVMKTDVSDEAQVAFLIEQIQDTMPPLRGVLHAAMILEDAALSQLDGDAFVRVMAPKAQGAWHLHRQTLDLPLDFFVLFSSVSALIGNAGQGNYVAANAFLDALAHYRRAHGLPAMSINWGMLQEAGVVARNPETRRYLEELGLRGFTTTAAFALLDDLFQRNVVQMGALDIDWKTWAAHSSARSPLYHSLLSQQGKSGVNSPFADALLLTPPAERQAFAETFILNHVARVLRASADRLDAQTGLDRFGIDSLMAVELSAAINLESGVQFSTMLMMRGPTIAQLATELLTQLITEEDEMLATIEEMSEAELDGLLELLKV